MSVKRWPETVINGVVRADCPSKARTLDRLEDHALARPPLTSHPEKVYERFNGLSIGHHPTNIKGVNL
jgi:hypothetical protein